MSRSALVPVLSTGSPGDRASSRLHPGHASRRSWPPTPGRLRRATRSYTRRGGLPKPPARPVAWPATAQRHTDLARRLTPHSHLEQTLLDRGVKDPVLLERAAAADRLTRQVMADVDASQPGSQAASITQAKSGVMPELRPGPEPAQADTAQLDEETSVHMHRACRGSAEPELAEAGRTAHGAQAGASELVRHAELPVRTRVEPSAWQPTAADVSPQCGAQAEAEMDERGIEL
jgi:hypothetical protein